MDKIQTITDIEIMLVNVPLRQPVQLGPMVIRQRDYVVVRLTLSNGAQGYAYGYERGMPLFDIVVRASRAYIGGSSADRNCLRKLAIGPTPAPQPSMIRGASLLDIALWDAWCQSADYPLWAMLGGAKRDVPIMPVIGYGITPERAVDEARTITSQGFHSLKLMIDGTQRRSDFEVMEALASALPNSVSFGIDAHWSWATVDQALPYCRKAEQLGASFVEDPFAPTQISAIRELADKIDIPLAVGEDVLDLNGFRELASIAGVMRVDASVIGGITGAIEAIAVAKAFNRTVIPHVFPLLHSQLAHAFDSISSVEMVMPGVGADPIEEFFVAPAKIEGGFIVCPSEPGVGLALRWDRLTQHCTQKERVRP